MNESVENLLLEHMRAMRADIGAIKEEMSGMRAEMLIIRQHMAGLLGAQTLHDGEIEQCGSLALSGLCPPGRTKRNVC